MYFILTLCPIFILLIGCATSNESTVESMGTGGTRELLWGKNLSHNSKIQRDSWDRKLFFLSKKGSKCELTSYNLILRKRTIISSQKACPVNLLWNKEKIIYWVYKDEIHIETNSEKGRTEKKLAVPSAGDGLDRDNWLGSIDVWIDRDSDTLFLALMSDASNLKQIDADGRVNVKYRQKKIAHFDLNELLLAHVFKLSREETWQEVFTAATYVGTHEGTGLSVVSKVRSQAKGWYTLFPSNLNPMGQGVKKDALGPKYRREALKVLETSLNEKDIWLYDLGDGESLVTGNQGTQDNPDLSGPLIYCKNFCNAFNTILLDKTPIRNVFPIDYINQLAIAFRTDQGVVVIEKGNSENIFKIDESEIGGYVPVVRLY